MKKENHIGCFSAKEAEAKLELINTNEKVEKYFFGNSEEMLDYLEMLKKSGEYKEYYYRLYVKDINWETGATKSGWVCVEGYPMTFHAPQN
ncbi:MAG: hypothetical protein J5382_09565 [Bacteroidales bacterium]|nr:hypothetical protein [Bacteroidales bacterium]